MAFLSKVTGLPIQSLILVMGPYNSFGTKSFLLYKKDKNKNDLYPNIGFESLLHIISMKINPKRAVRLGWPCIYKKVLPFAWTSTFFHEPSHYKHFLEQYLFPKEHYQFVHSIFPSPRLELYKLKWNTQCCIWNKNIKINIITLNPFLDWKVRY